MNQLDLANQGLAKVIVEHCKSWGYRIVTAESCTGGGVATVLSSIPGSSSVLWGGYVVYDRAAKVAMLGLSPNAVSGGKVYSREVARELAYGAHEKTNHRKMIALGITGVAGPGSDCGVCAGTVHIAAVHNMLEHDGMVLDGWSRFEEKLELGNVGREEVRDSAVRAGLELLLRAAQHLRGLETMIEMALAV